MQNSPSKMKSNHAMGKPGTRARLHRRCEMSCKCLGSKEKDDKNPTPSTTGLHCYQSSSSMGRNHSFFEPAKFFVSIRAIRFPIGGPCSKIGDHPTRLPAFLLNFCFGDLLLPNLAGHASILPDKFPVLANSMHTLTRCLFDPASFS